MVSLSAIACLLLATFPASILAHPKDTAGTAKLLDLHRRTAANGTHALEQCKDTIEARSYDQASAVGRVVTLDSLRQDLGFGPGNIFIILPTLEGANTWKFKSLVIAASKISIIGKTMLSSITIGHTRLAVLVMRGPKQRHNVLSFLKMYPDHIIILENWSDLIFPKI